MDDKAVHLRDIETARGDDWKQIRRFLWFVIAAAIASGIFFTADLLRFTLLEDAQTVVSILAPLVLYSLFVERTAEVYLTLWRGKEADELQLLVDQEEKRITKLKPTKTKPVDRSELDRLERKLTSYKASSRDVAFVFSLIFGIIIALAGARAMAQFLDPTSLEDMIGWQARWFNVVDIAVTGALIGGGADGMHKIVSLFTTFLDVNRSALKDKKK